MYAVKLLSQKKERFNEIELHRRLSSHHNILTFDKVVQHGDWTFLILEYASNGDLFSAITQPGSQIVGNNDAIRHIFLQIVDAVQYCHHHGIAHRDLKPENILMFPNWQVKLADFGLATTQTVSADFGCGSVFYFSPESQGGFIRNNTRIKGYGTQQNDVWSLGVILINLAAGRNPWKQASMNDPSFAAYVRNPSQFFKEILPCISTELNSILKRIFCLDPALRISLPELRLRILQCKSFTNKYAFVQSRRSFNIDSHIKQQEYQQKQRRPSSVVAAENKNNRRYNIKFQPGNNNSNSTTMEYTNSIAMTILHYIQDYIDEDRAFGINKIISTNEESTSTALHAHSYDNIKNKASELYLQPPTSPLSLLETSAINPAATSPTPSYSSSSYSSASSTASDSPSTPRIVNNTTTATTKFLDVNNSHFNNNQQARHFLNQNTSLCYHWNLEQH
ncbi:hypothetical protein INT45_011856 [Circinella minor]|uniref:Protein kinase domain-containing protein n=1 Tax=Circinella minor TaxID=1195481 RepID=A0A8H7S0R7_9FUNG|nr:hypothetical protein INT45_011856 [Circinella minor]